MHEALEHGRAAYDAAQWDAAYEALARANAARPLEPPDLWRLAMAAYLTGRDAQFTAILERAHHAWLGSGDLAGAARCAFWLGFALIEGSEIGRATGWFQRAGRLLDRTGGERVERGYLLLPTAMGQLESGDPAAAFRTAAKAVRLGEEFGDADLLALAVHLQGRALLEQRRLADGLALLDEAMVDVTAGVLSPLVTGLVYCSVIGACRRVYALDRAHEWTAALKAWCERQPELVPYRGLCLVYRAEIMQLHGAWQEALDEAARVLDSQQRGGGPTQRAARGAAHYQQGEVHRLRGEFAEAEAAYREASGCGREPQPGLALVRLALGDIGAARATIQRALAESSDAPRRARLLPAAAEIALAAGDIDDARQACHELDELAHTYDAAILAALATHARGAVALAEGDALAALIALRQACNAWRTLDAPWEEARTRVLLARACRDLGDDDAAALELEGARSAFARLGAAAELARLDAERLSGSAPTARSGDSRSPAIPSTSARSVGASIPSPSAPSPTSAPAAARPAATPAARPVARPAAPPAAPPVARPAPPRVARPAARPDTTPAPPPVARPAPPPDATPAAPPVARPAARPDATPAPPPVARPAPPRGGAHDLTRRELEVLALLATGLTNRAIAERMFISEKTVARHVSNIFAKLGVSTRAGATAHAYEHALIERAR